MSKEVILQGKVISGSERGKQFVNLPWVKRQLKEKLGFNPYPGTLNLQLANEKDIDELRRANGITIEPEKGYFKGKCFKALVMEKIEGAVVLPDVPEYPVDLLEILAPVNLRKTLRLKDGVEIEVTVRID
ncbi:MAG: CTP-dependent riboflavin kinase [Candidatus Bathyarchaeum sp.]|nr:MAG: CTP-dependent riboflavin kinase [Candidatus Bathyarchaeum sp.]